MKTIEVKLNTYGVLLIALFMSILVFLLGFVLGNWKRESEKIYFNKEELSTIIQLQTLEDMKKTGKEVVAWKTDSGSLQVEFVEN